MNKTHLRNKRLHEETSALCLMVWETMEAKDVCVGLANPGCADIRVHNTVYACARYRAQAVAWTLHRHDVGVARGR